MDQQILEAAARDVLSSAISGADWIDDLEPIMTEMNAVGGGPARPVPPGLIGMPTGGLLDAFSAFEAEAPPVTKADIIPLAQGEGFVADYMRPTFASKRRSQLCNEFQRPRGLYHEAAAILDDTPAGPVRLLVFRNDRQGPFEDDELRVLSRSLPYLRAAAMISRSSLREMAKRQAEPFERRGEPVFYLNVDGCVAEANSAAERALGRNVKIVRRRLVTTWPHDQSRLDRALTAALADERPSLVTLDGAEDPAIALALVLPVSGAAKDLFHATGALVVLIGPLRPELTESPALGLLSQATDLTRREADVVRVVGMGRSPRDAAAELGISYGTLRNHLKAGFAKLGVHTQGELVALIQRLC